MKKVNLNKVIKHPLFITCVGFVLTGILGVVFTNTYERIQNKKELREEAIEKRKELVLQFSELLYNRYTQSQLLLSALLRKAPTDELKRQKQSYDAAYSEWKTKSQIYLFSIREILSAQLFENFKFKLEGVVLSLNDADNCLIKAYDMYLSEKNKSTAVQIECSINEMHEQIYACLYATTDELYKLIANKLFDIDSTVFNKWSVDEALIKNCAGEK